MKIEIKAAIIAILINIMLPLILTPLATPHEIKPPNGAASLCYKCQFMHMMVHHNQVKITSSVIIGLIVYLSVLLSKTKFVSKLL